MTLPTITARGPGRSPRSNQAGLTLVEMMVSVVIVSIAVSAALTLGYTMVNGYRNQRRMIMVERGARVSLEILARNIRNSSPGVPSGNIQDLVGCTNNGTIRVVNSTTGPDELEVIHASGGVVTSARAAFTTADNALVVLDGSKFRPGDYVIISNLDVGHILPVTAVAQTGNTWTLTTSTPSSCGITVFPSGGYKPGATILRARIQRFFISTGPEVNNIPTLMVDPDGNGPLSAEPIAEGIEDMQVAVAVDVNGDGTVTEANSTTDEWYYNASGDATAPAMLVTPWRALRITLVARSVNETSDKPTSIRPTVEDRAGATSPDQFRRRVLSATVEVRNIQGSP